MPGFIFTASCPNLPGITAAVTTRIFEAGGDITEAQQHDDVATNRFFMRIEFDCPAPEYELRARMAEVAETYKMTWQMGCVGERPKVLILVSRFDHCLLDIIYRSRIGELHCEIVGVVSNHPAEAVSDLGGGLPFSHLPVTPETKAEQEAKLLGLVGSTGADLVVLARYMQVLSDDLVRQLTGRCINIHHSFLPGFKGAKPYHQAFERGVKMIGATAHYVTGDLDEGPIIAQDVEPITHTDLPDDLVEKGRDIERRVLARAVRLHLERRVLLNGTKTVIFTK